MSLRQLAYICPSRIINPVKWVYFLPTWFHTGSMHVVCKLTYYMYSRSCDDPDSGIRYVDSPLEFARPAIGSILLYMAIEGLLFFILTLLIEVNDQTTPFSLG